MQQNKTIGTFSRRQVVAGMLATTAFALTACSPKGGAASRVAKKQDLSISIMQQPGSLDPVALSEGSDSFLWSSIYDTLLLTSAEGKIVPNAAKSFDYSKDGKTLTLTLREGLLFSNGKVPTSKDVKFSLERIKTTPGPGQFQALNIASVDAPDDATVVIKLTTPDPNLLRYLTARCGIISDAATARDASTKLNPVGSGPYTLDTAKTTAGATYVLKRRDDYWGAATFPFANVTLKVMADTTAVENALRSGQIDVSTIAPTSQESFKKQNFTFTKLDVTSVFQLLIADRAGTIQPALADLRVRKAINMAFDRDAIGKSALAGLGTPTSQLFFPFFPGSVKKLDSLYPHDPEGARKLLAEAGYANGFDVKMPSLVYTPTFEPLITQALADIGIRVTWNPIPPQETSKAITSASYPMILWVDGVSPGATIINSHFTPKGYLNPFHVEDPRLAPLVAESAITIDPDRQAAIYEKINTFAVENAWDAPLAFNGQLFAAAPGYKYVGTSPMNLSSLRVFAVAA
ncbi:ABC transporter substrate-binding protein [Arthrobacter sp. B2a2-09]|uniref:ABC transporter substrate-binding protein n=1 Tax=Arthrobacter sp. B2a2-09 TaxID=2952822 RepID=UPI0022CD2C9C|nr:ABC transporter substrate-binding protein [Arthrobacter sp. B2a2-09]MCZ9880613.1 ABC transporter substrate-binding protein [Arthrobacter sp. B2a2-09]